MRKKRDIAWGLFYSGYNGKRCLWSSPNRADVLKAYRDLGPGTVNAPTKPFRIAPPKKSTTKAAEGGGKL